MAHKRDFPKVVINVGGVKHEVKLMNPYKTIKLLCHEGNVGGPGEEASDQTRHVRWGGSRSEYCEDNNWITMF